MCWYTYISLLTKTYFVQLAIPKPHFFSRGAAPEAPVRAAPPNPRLITFYTLWAPWKPYTGLLAALSAKCSAENFKKSYFTWFIYFFAVFFFVTTRRTSSGSLRSMHLPSKVEKKNRKKICKGKSSHWLQRGFVCSNTKYDLLERVLIYRFSEFLHSYMLHLMFTWEFVCSKALKMCGTLVLIYQYVLSYWMAQ